MKSLLNKAQDQPNIPSGRFEKFNLRENPFPSTPVINKGNDDKRYNGEIYEKEIRAAEYNTIETNFLKVPQSDPNHLRLGFVLDTSYVGRGNGKSSFSLNLLKKINENYCYDISEKLNKCFGLYIMPETSGKTKSFVSVLDLIFLSILENKLIDYSLAALRLDALLNLDNENIKLIESLSEDEVISKFNSLEWFYDNKIEIYALNKIIQSNNYIKNISAFSFIETNQYNSLFPSFENNISKSSLVEKYRTLKANEKANFIFNDLVNLFLASGFNGAYIIIDDFERIPDFQSDRQKRDFALELRTCFFDGVTTNARLGFYNLILMLHAGVPALIEKTWAESGMEQRSPITNLSEHHKHVVFFDKLTKDHARLLIRKYLSEYRIEKTTDSLSPFMEDAVELISEFSEYNAAKILRTCNMLLEYVVDKGLDKINADVVKNFTKERVEIEEEDARNISDMKSINLHTKAKK